MKRPARRSRKIGLTQGGRVRGGRSSEKWSRIFTRDIWDRLSAERDDDSPAVLRENPSSNYYHPCSGTELLEVLRRLPGELSGGVRAIVLRRTSKLDEDLGVEARRRFQCVILNAFPRSNRMTWKRPVSAAARRHYGRWCSRWMEQPSATVLQWTTDEVRRYYLFHLFLHEIGHINQPWFHSLRRREEFAENFALEWAKIFDELPPPIQL